MTRSNRITLIKRLGQLSDENARLREAMTGWSSYAWKNDVYIDDVGDFFEMVLKGGSVEDAVKEHGQTPSK